MNDMLVRGCSVMDCLFRICAVCDDWCYDSVEWISKELMLEEDM